MSYDTKEFIEGQRDCRDGKLAKQNASVSYNAGYGAQYELEQNPSNVEKQYGFKPLSDRRGI